MCQEQRTYLQQLRQMEQLQQMPLVVLNGRVNHPHPSFGLHSNATVCESEISGIHCKLMQGKSHEIYSAAITLMVL